MKQEESAERSALPSASRIVIKVGTRVLVDPAGRPDARRIKRLAAELAELRRDGIEVVLVTSGAIGAGMQALMLRRRPKSLPDLQMAAAVGQGRLMSMYQQAFEGEKLLAAQVLLTYDDLRHRVRHLNARNTMLALLRNGIVPVVNENDTVAVDEIKVGDNDVLAALVTALIGADLLILLSTTDGLRSAAKGGSRIPFLPSVTPKALALAAGKGSDLSTGGMQSKLQAAQTAAKSGASVVIADGRKRGVIAAVIAGRDRGTLIGTAALRAKAARGKRRWIAFFDKPRGVITVDDGAAYALEHLGRSLLPIGVRRVDGRFEKGATVDVISQSGAAIARGLVELSDAELRSIAGKKSSEVFALIPGAAVEAIHRDNLVLLRSGHGSDS